VEQALPKAIQAQLEEAEAIEKQIAAELAAPNGNTQDDVPNQAQPEAPDADKVTEPTPTEVNGLDTEDDGWKKRFDVLTGKYNAEVPRLYQQLKDQAQALEAVQKQLDDAKAKPAEPEPKRESLVTSNDEDTFGSDLIDLARRVTRDEVGALNNKIDKLESMLSQITDLSKQVEVVSQNQAESVSERFWNAVEKRIPGWNEIDTDQRWIEFLNQAPQFSVKTYRELAGEAINAGQIEPLAAMVDTWKAQSGITSQQNAKQELARQVAPTKQNGSNVPQGKKVWTMAEYERAYDPRLGAEMSESEIEALQAEADLALTEGRLQA
jgi:hypothetical protein